MKSIEEFKEVLDSGEFEDETDILEGDGGRDVLREVRMESPHPFREGVDREVGLGSHQGATSYYHAVLVNKESDTPRGEYLVTEWTPTEDIQPEVINELDLEINRFEDDYLVVSFHYGTVHAGLDKPDEDSPYDNQEQIVKALVRGMATTAQSYHLRNMDVDTHIVGDEIPASLREQYEKAGTEAVS